MTPNTQFPNRSNSSIYGFLYSYSAVQNSNSPLSAIIPPLTLIPIPSVALSLLPSSPPPSTQQGFPLSTLVLRLSASRPPVALTFLYRTIGHCLLQSGPAVRGAISSSSAPTRRPSMISRADERPSDGSMAAAQAPINSR